MFTHLCVGGGEYTVTYVLLPGLYLGRTVLQSLALPLNFTEEELRFRSPGALSMLAPCGSVM